MRAIRVSGYGGPEMLRIASVDTPEPGRGEVRIEVRAAGVNFADVEQRRGRYPDGPTPPYTPGLEVAGVVDAVGPGTLAPIPSAVRGQDDGGDRPIGAEAARSAGGGDALSVGDRVAAVLDAGGYAERAIASAARTVRIPPELSWPEAAAVPVQWVTAHNALHEWGRLEAGERVLVTAAAGGVGSAAVQLAVDAGVDGRVIGTASTPEKLDLIRRLGASRAIDYEREDVPATIDQYTDGAGVALALDGVGGRAFADAVEALAPGGRVVTYGMASGTVPTVATPRLFFANKSVIGYHLAEALERTPERVLAAVPRVIERLADGAVEVVLDETVPLEAAATAHRRLESRETAGKLVLLPGGGT